MVRILPLVGVIGLMLYTFFDVLATDRRRFTSLSKSMWLLVAFIPVIGGLLWLTVGRPRRSGTSGSVISLNRRPRPVAPDDDPEFLRRLDEQAWRARRESARAAEEPPAEAPSSPSEQTSSDAEHHSDSEDASDGAGASDGGTASDGAGASDAGTASDGGTRSAETTTDAVEDDGPKPPTGER